MVGAQSNFLVWQAPLEADLRHAQRHIGDRKNVLCSAKPSFLP